MNTSLNKRSATLANAILLAGRLLLAGIFLHEGVYLAANFGAAAAGMAKTGIPPLVLIATIALQLPPASRLRLAGMSVWARQR